MTEVRIKGPSAGSRRPVAISVRMSLGSCEFWVDDQQVSVSVPSAWGRAQLPERRSLVRTFMAERNLPAYVEPQLLQAIKLLEPQPDPDQLFGGAAATAGIAAWARVLDSPGGPGDDDTNDDDDGGGSTTDDDDCR